MAPVGATLVDRASVVESRRSVVGVDVVDDAGGSAPTGVAPVYNNAAAAGARVDLALFAVRSSTRCAVETYAAKGIVVPATLTSSAPASRAGTVADTKKKYRKSAKAGASESASQCAPLVLDDDDDDDNRDGRDADQ